MKKLTLFLLLSNLTLTASAIVVQDYAAAEVAPAGLDWSNVYNYKTSSAVAVHANWLLTAAHVADDGLPSSITNGTTIHTQQEIAYNTNNWDLALVRFDQPFADYYPLYEGAFDSLNKSNVVMVGFGSTGTVSSNSWTPGSSGRNIKRWGTQVIDNTEQAPNSVGGQDVGFWMNFNLGATTHEAGVGYGDSGGGVFFDDGGTWKLAGIMTQKDGSPNNRTFGVSLFVDEPADWIGNTIPEPATTGLMGLSILGLYFGRSLHRRKKAITKALTPGTTYLCDSYVSTTPIEEQGIVWASFDESTPREEDTSPFEKWINLFNDGFDALADAYWEWFGYYLEEASERHTELRNRLRGKLNGKVDLLLDKVRWDQAFTAISLGVEKIKQRSIRHVDRFLENVSWDKSVSRYKRLRRSTRYLWRRRRY